VREFFSSLLSGRIFGMTEYRVLSADSPSDLAKKVNEALAEKWQPTGGVSAVWDGIAKYKLHQALVR
jgi:hypothetical protein